MTGTAASPPPVSPLSFGAALPVQPGKVPAQWSAEIGQSRAPLIAQPLPRLRRRPRPRHQGADMAGPSVGAAGRPSSEIT